MLKINYLKYHHFFSHKEVEEWNKFYGFKSIYKEMKSHINNETNDPNYIGAYKCDKYISYNMILRNPQITEEEIKKIYSKEYSLPKQKEYLSTKPINYYDIEKSKKEINILQNFICSHQIPENIAVYRFMNDQEYKALNNSIKTIPNFLSTILYCGEKPAYSYMEKVNNIIKILIPKGTQGISIPNISEMCENEILLPHHTTLIFVGQTSFQNYDHKIPTFICATNRRDVFGFFIKKYAISLLKLCIGLIVSLIILNLILTFIK